MDALATPEVRIDCYIDDGVPDSIADEVREGLTRPLKELPPKYFYDARGSQLFDRITTLPEYYPTRCERSILNRYAPEIVESTGAQELVELGSGTASKTRALLYAMAGAGTLERYLPFDVDESVVQACATELTELYPGLRVHGVVGDFDRDLERVPDGQRRLFAFLGGTIGNFFPEERASFLARVRELMNPGDHLLIGTDLVKDRRVLEAAYNDSEGVTAEFNRNILRVLNDGLAADFDPSAFEHVAFFDEANSWIEMRLRSKGAQRVRIDGADLEVEFEDGEEIRTEISSKFTREAVARELAGAGLRLDDFFTDDDGLFGVAFASSR
ncbi:MAG TPA: L-histidine N(alpha)-methyltransferase [Thermoleophilaceae bacterium]